MMIELLLIKDVDGLGKRGAAVKVKSGYARNHLLPLGFAVHATEDNKRQVDKKRVAWLAEEAQRLEELRELAAHLAKMDIKIVEKASETGHLFGSVTEKSIAEAVGAQGLRLDPKAVRLDQHLKEVGDYEVLVRMHEEVEVTLPVKVRMEGREDWLPGDDEPVPETAADEAGPETPAEDARPAAD